MSRTVLIEEAVRIGRTPDPVWALVTEQASEHVAIRHHRDDARPIEWRRLQRRPVVGSGKLCWYGCRS